MAQVTIYIPDEIEKEIKRQAKKARKSFSAYVTELASRSLRPVGWPKEFRELYGSWEGKFPEIEDLPPEDDDEP